MLQLSIYLFVLVPLHWPFEFAKPIARETHVVNKVSISQSQLKQLVIFGAVVLANPVWFKSWFSGIIWVFDLLY